MPIPEGYPTVFLSQSHKTFLVGLDAADVSKDSLTSVAESLEFGIKTVNRLLPNLIALEMVEASEETTVGYLVTDLGREQAV